MYKNITVDNITDTDVDWEILSPWWIAVGATISVPENIKIEIKITKINFWSSEYYLVENVGFVIYDLLLKWMAIKLILLFITI